MSIFADLADHAQLPFVQGRMLPSAAYTSPDVLAEEHRRIFARSGCASVARPIYPTVATT